MQRKFLSSLFILAFIFMYSLYGAQAEMESKILKMFIRVDPFDQFQLIGAKWTSLNEHYHFEGVDFRFIEAMVSKGKLFLAWEASTEEDFNIEFWSSSAAKEGKVYSVGVHMEKVGLSREGMLDISSYLISLNKTNDELVGYIFEHNLPIGIPDEIELFLECRLSVEQIYPNEGPRKEKQVLFRIHPTVEIPVTTKIPIPLPKLKSENYPIVVPENYEKNGVLPIYKAVPRDYKEGLNLKYFNKSEIIEESESTIFFADGGELYASTYGLSYKEYDRIYDPLNSDVFQSTERRPSIASQVKNIASHAFWDMTRYETPTIQWGDLQGGFPERENLEKVSLTQAKKLAEELLSSYHMDEYELDFALDMPLSRIESWGDAVRKDLEGMEDIILHDFTILDYQMATVEDEGYYLIYKRKEKGVYFANNDTAEFYITGKGIVFANLEERYRIGEILRNSAKIKAPEIIVKNLSEELLLIKKKTRSLQIIGMQLLFDLGIAKEGKAFAPAWKVVFLSDQTEGKIEYAIFDACTGHLDTTSIIR